jgi:hypothetical protein
MERSAQEFYGTIESKMNNLQEEFEKAIQDILSNHRKIIDDWCKAYMAQRFEEGKSIKPGSFTLCEQVETYHKGKDCMVKRYWFENGIPEFDKDKS